MSILPAVTGARLRHARLAVSVVFFINAALYANLVPRLPEIKDSLGLTNAEVGSAVAGMPAGALLAGLLAPALIRRLGSASIAALGLVGLATAVAGVSVARSWLGLAAVMLVVGALDAVVDVAQNAHGLRVQRAYGRSLLNSLHALWSVGAVAGGLLGSAAAGLQVPLAAHLVGSAVLFSLMALAARRFLLPGPEDAERVATADADAGRGADPGAGTRPARRLRQVTGRTVALVGVLGLLAACEAFVQDAGSSWSALFMQGTVGTGAAVGGLAFVSMQVAGTLGRVFGDRLVDRHGQRRIARLGGATTAVGMGLALAVPSVGTALVGFALAGLGVATLFPAVMHAADELPGLPRGMGLALVVWLLRAGFLVSPVVIGVVADATSLRLALVTVVVAGTAATFLGRVLPSRTGAAEPAPTAGHPA